MNANRHKGNQYISCSCECLVYCLRSNAPYEIPEFVVWHLAPFPSSCLMFLSKSYSFVAKLACDSSRLTEKTSGSTSLQMRQHGQEWASQTLGRLLIPNAPDEEVLRTIILSRIISIKLREWRWMPGALYWVDWSLIIKPTIDDVGNIRLYVHRHLWWTSVLSTQDI